ncbi:MAG: 5'/3'-nucleotidase SurE [Candidatus Muiribacteriaceae bacterium]
MHFLLCNDDGIRSHGLIELAEAVSEIGKVIVFAPDRERSACSSAMTLKKELKVRKAKDFPVACEAYSVCGGYPVDCAKTGIFFMQEIRKLKIRCVISGINKGENTGIDIRYSGTVGAAFDGLDKDLISIAVSLASYEPSEHGFKRAARFTRDYLADHLDIISKSEYRNFLYNINYPDMPDVKEIVYTRPAHFSYREVYHHKGEDDDFTLMLEGERVHEAEGKMKTDLEVVERGKVSISLLRPEFIHEIPIF